MFIAVALLVAGLFIAFLLHHFIQRQVDERLDSQILFLASMLRADNSTLSLSGSADGPPFDRPARGWYWQVTGPDNTLRARALGDKALDLSSASLHPPPRPPRPRRVGERAGDRPLPTRPPPQIWAFSGPGSQRRHAARRRRRRGCRGGF